MTPRLHRLRTLLTAIVIVFGLGVAGIVYGPWLKDRMLPGQTGSLGAADSPKSVELVPDQADSIRLLGDVARELGVKTAVAQSASRGPTLELPGTLMVDTNRLSRVHARFAGEVVGLGRPAGASRPIDSGDHVVKDQLLAIVWSRDLGEKKSELVDGLSQLRVDEETLARLKATSAEGAIPERTLRDAERRVEADRIVVDRALRTLETWRVPQEEIDAVRAEAATLSKKPDRVREELVERWARSEVRCPLDGVILERNIAMGDLVDTSLDLFKIADLTRLRVVAHAYEEDLPALDGLKGDDRRWTVRMGSDPEAETRGGRFEGIGQIIDPNQHTALVRGWVENPDGRLRVGQFVTAVVELPQQPNEAAIPASALVEIGSEPIVFVQPDEHDARYVRRRVALLRRTAATVYVGSRLTPEQEHRGIQPLRAGERVVSSGAVQLTAALNELQSTAALAREPGKAMPR